LLRGKNPTRLLQGRSFYSTVRPKDSTVDISRRACLGLIGSLARFEKRLQFILLDKHAEGVRKWPHMARSKFTGLEPFQKPDFSVGKMIVTCTDDGNGVLIPSVEFDPPGKITPGWFDRHVPMIQREIQKAQVLQRTGRSR